MSARLKAISACLAAALLVGVLSAAPARTTSALSTDGVRERETSVGDLVADAIKQAGGADAALVSAAQFKPGAIKPGKVTAADVSALLIKPDRNWVVSSLSGKTIKAALERSLSRVPDPSAHFLQVSGLRVTYNKAAPAGTRVKGLKIGGAAVKPGTKYRIAMPEDLAKGGSGYFTIAEFNEGTIVQGTGGPLSEAIGEFLEGQKTLNYSNLNRIVASTE